MRRNAICTQKFVVDGLVQSVFVKVVSVTDAAPGPGVKMVPVKLNPFRNESGNVMLTLTFDKGAEVSLLNTKMPPPPGERVMGCPNPMGTASPPVANNACGSRIGSAITDDTHEKRRIELTAINRIAELQESIICKKHLPSAD